MRRASRRLGMKARFASSRRSNGCAQPDGLWQPGRVKCHVRKPQRGCSPAARSHHPSVRSSRESTGNGYPLNASRDSVVSRNTRSDFVPDVHGCPQLGEDANNHRVFPYRCLASFPRVS
jgi:hypothetical protein